MGQVAPLVNRYLFKQFSNSGGAFSCMTIPLLHNQVTIECLLSQSKALVSIPVRSDLVHTLNCFFSLNFCVKMNE